VSTVFAALIDIWPVTAVVRPTAVLVCPNRTSPIR